MTQNGKSNRGFRAMDAQKRREISSLGGKAAHEKGTAHQFTREEAREAGRKGGAAVSQNREHMAEIGRRGAEARNESLYGTRRPGGASEDGTTQPVPNRGYRAASVAQPPGFDDGRAIFSAPVAQPRPSGF